MITICTPWVVGLVVLTVIITILLILFALINYAVNCFKKNIPDIIRKSKDILFPSNES